MSQRFVLGCVLLASTLIGCGDSSSSATTPRGLVVETASGPVEGLEDDGVFSYRGIPYAAPPVDDLRWKPPVDPEPWTETLGATEKGNICPQVAFLGLPSPGFIPSEDCLYINIDTPDGGFRLARHGLDPWGRLHGGRGGSGRRWHRRRL